MTGVGMDTTIITGSPIVERIEEMSRDVLRFLPGLGAACAVFLIVYLLSKRVRGTTAYVLRRAGRNPNTADVFGRLARWLTVFGGFLVAMTIALPSFAPAQLIEFLGIGSVAIGFAFRDILQNFLAGILILLAEPFRIGDAIVINQYEGIVEDIEIRATILRTYDGRRIVIPNTNLFTGSVIVNTAYSSRRTEYLIGVGYGDDLDQARQIIVEALLSVPDVLRDPAPEALVAELAPSSVNIRARWWIRATGLDGTRVQDEVLRTIKTRLTAAGIDLPFPTQQILFHDQTEATDGDRAHQREGWPAGDSSPPEPLRIVDALRGLHDQTGSTHAAAVTPYSTNDQ